MFSPDEIKKLDEIKKIMDGNRVMFDKYILVAYTERCNKQIDLMMRACIHSEVSGKKIRLSVIRGLHVPSIVIERCQKIVYHEGRKDLVEAMKVLFTDDE